VFIRVHLWLIGFFFLRGRASRKLQMAQSNAGRNLCIHPSSFISHLFFVPFAPLW
jgi:hypothetical protein